MLEVISMFQDMVESAVNILGLWEVLSMFQDIMESAVIVSGYGGNCCQCFRIVGSGANVGSDLNVSGYGGKCCHCFRIWWNALSLF